LQTVYELPFPSNKVQNIFDELEIFAYEVDKCNMKQINVDI